MQCRTHVPMKECMYFLLYEPIKLMKLKGVSYSLVVANDSIYEISLHQNGLLA